MTLNSLGGVLPLWFFSFINKSPVSNLISTTFAGSESISKRYKDLNEFLQKNFEKLDLKLKSVSSIIPKLALLFTLLKQNLLPHMAKLLLKKN